MPMRYAATGDAAISTSGGGYRGDAGDERDERNAAYQAPSMHGPRALDGLRQAEGLTGTLLPGHGLQTFKS